MPQALNRANTEHIIHIKFKFCEQLLIIKLSRYDNKINSHHLVTGDDARRGLIEHDPAAEGVGVRDAAEGVGGGRLL